MTNTTNVVSELVALVLERIRGRDDRAFSLDELGEVIGSRSISSADIDLLMTQLESKGVEIGGDRSVDLKATLVIVLQTARFLRSQGKATDTRAIAAASGLSFAAVKMALLYSDVIRRP